jgi:hypothetical protein
MATCTQATYLKKAIATDDNESLHVLRCILCDIHNDNHCAYIHNDNHCAGSTDSMTRATDGVLYLAAGPLPLPLQGPPHATAKMTRNSDCPCFLPSAGCFIRQ